MHKIFVSSVDNGIQTFAIAGWNELKVFCIKRRDGSRFSQRWWHVDLAIGRYEFCLFDTMPLKAFWSMYKLLLYFCVLRLSFCDVLQLQWIDGGVFPRISCRGRLFLSARLLVNCWRILDDWLACVLIDLIEFAW
ncbi:hypothetical protein MPSEU_000574200 [Mayamaea pseudoterrestris]|nr:hypothetical protein MPSEU_000574200 [Mayamaea pseudoterrestris]